MVIKSLLFNDFGCQFIKPSLNLIECVDHSCITFLEFPIITLMKLMIIENEHHIQPIGFIPLIIQDLLPGINPLLWRNGQIGQKPLPEISISVLRNNLIDELFLVRIHSTRFLFDLDFRIQWFYWASQNIRLSAKEFFVSLSVSIDHFIPSTILLV